MCNQWLIAQPASVQRPVKLYSSHPISDRLHFKNCLLEEGHTHPHRWNTLSDTQGKQGCAYTFEPLQNSHKPHFISGSHASATHKQPLGLSGLLWFPPPPVQIKCLLSEKKKNVIKILLERGCLWILACGSCETRPLRVLGQAAAPARPPLLHGV